MQGRGQAGERELWDRAAADDPTAFAALFDRHHDRIFRHAFRVLRDRSDAEDVTAPAFLELWRRRGRVRLVEDSVLPWLLVTATNVARNVTRASARYRRLLASLPHPGTAPSAEDVAVHGADDGPVLRAVGSLKPADQALIVMVDVEGFPIVAAAEALRISQGTARVRLHRARNKLRADLVEADQEVAHA